VTIFDLLLPMMRASVRSALERGQENGARLVVALAPDFEAEPPRWSQ
jgi:hypothetical protein